MKQQDKELLLVDLCARLPYHPVIKWINLVNGSSINEELGDLSEINLFFISQSKNNEAKPYLRPMSSMTLEEKEEMHNLLSPEGTAIYDYDGISMPMNHYGEFVSYKFMNNVIHYLIEKHFDFMSLIPKGLAIEVTEENNPYK